MTNVREMTAEDRAEQVYRSYEYLAERGVFDIVYEEAAEILSDQQARALARRVSRSVRTHANMAGVDVPPPAEEATSLAEHVTVNAGEDDIETLRREVARQRLSDAHRAEG
jgi:hypothetical protein